jgi:hypothetical protein
VAPYADVTLRVPFPLATAVAAERARGIVLGFAIARDRNSCDPRWGGDQAPTYLAGDAAALRAGGVTVIPSFGGAAGTELAAACPDAGSLAGAYSQILLAGGYDQADFDIEGGVLENAAATARRSAAIAMLQAAAAGAGHPLAIDLTLPVDPSGLDAAALRAIRSAVASGVSIRAINLMVMDYGPDAASQGRFRMGGLALRAARSVHGQLASVFPGASDADLWHVLALTPMIGRNDERRQVTTLADARRIGAFARANGLGRVSFWSISRDRRCPGRRQPRTAKNSCSGIRQSAGAFARALSG